MTARASTDAGRSGAAAAYKLQDHRERDDEEYSIDIYRENIVCCDVEHVNITRKTLFNC